MITEELIEFLQENLTVDTDLAATWEGDSLFLVSTVIVSLGGREIARSSTPTFLPRN
jgi:hypothetical protein